VVLYKNLHDIDGIYQYSVCFFFDLSLQLKPYGRLFLLSWLVFYFVYSLTSIGSIEVLMLLILLQNLVVYICHSIVYSFFQLVLVVNILKSLKIEISLIFFMKLTTEQIEYVCNYIKSFDIKWYELQVEFTDHMVTSMEIWEKESELTFLQVKQCAESKFSRAF
jgi:hypothetical protein